MSAGSSRRCASLLADPEEARRLGAERAPRGAGAVLDRAVLRREWEDTFTTRHRAVRARGTHAGRTWNGSLPMKRRVLMISEHASPLAVLGGADSGGQNVYVAQVASHWPPRVTRSTSSPGAIARCLPAAVLSANGVRVVHVPAGPAGPVRKEELLPYMAEFADFTLGYVRRRGGKFDLIHANFFMSALVAAEIKRATGMPFVVTFHALGRVRRSHQGGADTFPGGAAGDRGPGGRRGRSHHCRVSAGRARPGRALRRRCREDRDDSLRLRSRRSSGRCDQAEARARLGLPQDEPIVLQLGRMVPRKGVDNVIRGLARLRRVARDRGPPARGRR